MNAAPIAPLSSPDTLKKASPFLHAVLNELSSEEDQRRAVSDPIPLQTTEMGEQALLYAEQTQSLQLQQSESTALKIVTNDGDEITLQMRSEWQVAAEYASTYSNSAEGESHSQYAALQQHQGYAIQYQVEGELDEGELEALDQLMKQVSVASDHFFSGNLAGAISELSEFELDTDEFTAMSLQMQRSVTYSMAESYKEVSQMRPSSLPHSSGQPANLLGLSSFVQEMQEMMNQLDEYLERIFEPNQFVGGVLEQAIERDPRSEPFSRERMAEIREFLQLALEEMHPTAESQSSNSPSISR